MSSIEKIIKGQNSKKCGVNVKAAEKKWNCRNASNCPLNGKRVCVVYKVAVEQTEDEENLYIGFTEGNVLVT